MANVYDYSEADTRAEMIDKQLQSSGWESGDDVRVQREYSISVGKIIGENRHSSRLSADYVLFYKNVKLAVVEAKKSSRSYSDGVAQAKLYADLLNVRYTYATNGDKIYQIDMETGKEGEIESYPTPEELWKMTFEKDNELFNLLSSVPFNIDKYKPRYYQENSVNAVMEALSNDSKRILLTLATGTGKTYIAFQIVWKLMQARWNVDKVGERLPRVLFLADRNILADQAFNAFEMFPKEALARIEPDSIRKSGRLPDAQSIFFTIFQTFMSGEKPRFGQYPKNFFDFIIIDECHRGGANDESNWRGILEYFDSAVQLGLTATPKRKDNVDTYKYFGNPVYTYSLKQAINDGYLTPFKVRNIRTNFETYEYKSSDIVKGEIDTEKIYNEPDFNRKIELREKELLRVKDFMSEIDQNDKTLVFCATQNHAGVIRDLINQVKNVSKNVNYCVRVTADDGDIGEQFLRQFQDTEKTIPTILTTSQKLSTGVDAIQVKNIVLLRPVNSMIEFKQIIGRGTRLCDGKTYFTIFDYVNASKNFEDPEWDGPIEYVGKHRNMPTYCAKKSNAPQMPIEITLGKGRQIQIVSKNTSIYDERTGSVISIKDFIQRLSNELPNFFDSEEKLKEMWVDPLKRKELLSNLGKSGYNREKLLEVQKLLNAENKDLFDVLMYIAYNKNMISREERAKKCIEYIRDKYKNEEIDFIKFVLKQYVENGVAELSDENIAKIIKLKYGTPLDAERCLGNMKDIRSLFLNFQYLLYLA